jgi:hypothetical protein
MQSRPSNRNLRETILRLARLFDRLADTAEKHERMLRDAAAFPALRNSTPRLSPPFLPSSSG